eukprot:4143219-Amphidinium_carterae.1
MRELERGVLGIGKQCPADSKDGGRRRRLEWELGSSLAGFVVFVALIQNDFSKNHSTAPND